MKHIVISQFSKFFNKNKQGVSGATYGLLVGLIAVVAISSIGKIGDSVGILFSKVDNNLTAAANDGTTTGGGEAGDQTAPQISSFSSLPSDGIYETGTSLDFSVLFTESVFVSGTPQLTIDVDSGIVTADYVSGDGTDTFLFSYLITGSDVDIDGISLNALIGSIADAAGNAAILDLPVVDLSAVLINPCGAAPQEAFTSGASLVNIPTGCSSMTVKLWGAGGAGWLASAVGGGGAFVSADFAVAPSDVFQINVGGAGLYNNNVTSTVYNPINAFNGGGRAGGLSGDGGGASDIRFGGTALTDRIIVAGAGGGGGSSFISTSGTSQITAPASGNIAGNASDTDRNGAGQGGAIGTDGTAGRVVIIWN